MRPFDITIKSIHFGLDQNALVKDKKYCFSFLFFLFSTDNHYCITTSSNKSTTNAIKTSSKKDIHHFFCPQISRPWKTPQKKHIDVTFFASSEGLDRCLLGFVYKIQSLFSTRTSLKFIWPLTRDSNCFCKKGA